MFGDVKIMGDEFGCECVINWAWIMKVWIRLVCLIYCDFGMDYVYKVLNDLSISICDVMGAFLSWP